MGVAAFWFQDAGFAESIASSNRTMTIFTGLVALSMLVQAIAISFLAFKLVAAIKDVLATFDMVKGKLLPLIASSQEMLASAQAIVADATPKIKTVTENLVQTSNTVRTTATQLQTTVSDANMRTQRQVARVDGMISTALTTTAEIVETMNHGIRVPAQKIAVIASQAKSAIEGAFEKVKSMTAASPFGTRKGPTNYR